MESRRFYVLLSAVSSFVSLDEVFSLTVHVFYVVRTREYYGDLVELRDPGDVPAV